jgi:hypothetical protein
MRYTKKITNPLKTGLVGTGGAAKVSCRPTGESAIPFAKARLSTIKHASAIAVSAIAEQDIEDINAPAPPGFPNLLQFMAKVMPNLFGICRLCRR